MNFTGDKLSQVLIVQMMSLPESTEIVRLHLLLLVLSSYKFIAAIAIIDSRCACIYVFFFKT